MNDFQAGRLMKAVTFSYDDGITQDIQMIELMKNTASEQPLISTPSCWAPVAY